jgi:hypothetical protein
MLMIQAVPSDILYICAELMTGKSIPVLVAITRLPVGQGLAWVMVCLGGLAGTCFSVLVTHETRTLSLISFTNRLLQLCFSVGLSISLLLSIANGIHPERGVALAVIPAFCLLAQPLPQRHSTALVSFLLCCATFYVCAIMAAVDEGRVASHPSHLLPAARQAASAHAAKDGLTLTVPQIISRALQLFALAFYACIQHAPTQIYFETTENARPNYASHHHANHVPYSFFIGMVGGWLRVCVWSGLCFFQDNPLHAMLENSVRADEWSWPCCIIYMTTLLFSACWTSTQIKEQIIPRFISGRSNVGIGFIKGLVLAIAVAAVFRQRDPDAMFYAANVLMGVSILSAILTLKGGGYPAPKM